jgi:hypothetical protein
MPSQPPFAVMQGHPVPPWNRYVSVHPFQNHRPSDVFLTSASSLPGATSIHLPPPVSYSSTSTTSAIKPILKVVYIFLFDFLPRQLYLSLLLGLPSLYFTRVARVFEDAELSKPDIKKMVHTTANEWEGRVVLMNWNNTPLLSPALLTFKRSWEEFVDSLMREWKTLNVVSVLLLSCVYLIVSPELI